MRGNALTTPLLLCCVCRREVQAGDRHNLMGSSLGKAERSWGIRGNIFSFLLPWEDVLGQLFTKIEDGDLSEWPLAPEIVGHVVRVKFVRGPTNLVDKFQELRVRSKVVKKLAAIYIEKNVQDLAQRPGVLKIHTFQKCATVAESLKKHATQRVDRLYPEANGLLPGIEITADESTDTAWDNKQATGHDHMTLAPGQAEKVFQHVRPNIVVDEGDSKGSFAPEVVLEHAVDNIAEMTIQKNPFNSTYQCCKDHY